MARFKIPFFTALYVLGIIVVSTESFRVSASEVQTKSGEVTANATATVEGIVVDVTGKAVENAVVSAYINPTTNKKPVFVSLKTGADGQYVLRVSRGTYYLKVGNNDRGGPPSPGQIVGYFGERTPPKIDIKDGQIIKGLNFRVILFSERRGPFPGPVPTANPRPGPGPQR